MADFWRDCGHHLLRPTESGGLAVTDDFLRAYFRRPEMRPVAESCAAERALHEALMRAPRMPVEEARLSALADPDARDNYRVVLAFRARLLEAESLEACYLACLRDPAGVRVPPLFLDQLVHVILRRVLEGCADALRVRAGELLFRAQTITIDAEKRIMAADAETVEMLSATGGLGALGQLLIEAQTPLRRIELDVLDSHNADLYWAREKDHDTVLNLSFAGGGLDALCRVLEAWVGHFHGIETSIQPVRQIRDERWAWHIGLDAEGSRLLNDLYNGVEVGEARLARLLSLFRLEFADPGVVRPEVAGRPVYLAMAMAEDSILRLKPQNLLINLPLAGAS